MSGSPPPAPPAAPPPPPPAAAPPTPASAVAPVPNAAPALDAGGGGGAAAQGNIPRKTKVKVVTLDHQKAALGILIDKQLGGAEIMDALKEEFPDLKAITDEKAVTRLLEAVKNFLSRVFKKQECFTGRVQCFQCEKHTKNTGESKYCETLHPTIKARPGYRLTCSDIKKPVNAKWGLLQDPTSSQGICHSVSSLSADITQGQKRIAEGAVDENPEAKKAKEDAAAIPVASLPVTTIPVTPA